MDINKLLELNERAKDNARQYDKRRELYTRIKNDAGRHFTGIVGPRGVGKTVLLQQILLDQQGSFYVSLDMMNTGSLFDLVQILTGTYKIKLLLLDEIHFLKQYQGELKKIYDFFKIKIIFTSSVSLSMYESAYDLSRRVVLFHLYPFSFREYIYFKRGIMLPALTLDDLVHSQWSSEHLMYEYLFDEYLKGGLFPFALEEPDIYPVLNNIILKIVQKDIPSISSLLFEEPEKIMKVIEFTGKSQVDGINFSSLSRNTGITKYKAEQYVKLLEKTFILNPVYPAGTNVLKEPKILMYLPYRLLYKDYEDVAGALREDFFAETMKRSGNIFSYLKTKKGKKTPDYITKLNGQDIIIEIGGKGKGRTQFKGIDIKRKIIFCQPYKKGKDRIPLFLLGLI